VYRELVMEYDAMLKWYLLLAAGEEPPPLTQQFALDLGGGSLWFNSLSILRGVELIMWGWTQFFIAHLVIAAIIVAVYEYCGSRRSKKTRR